MDFVLDTIVVLVYNLWIFFFSKIYIIYNFNNLKVTMAYESDLTGKLKILIY